MAENKQIIDELQEALKDYVSEVTFTNELVDAPVCLSTKDNNVSLNMEEMFERDPNMQGKMKVEKVLKINPESKLFKLVQTFKGDEDKIKSAAKVLYDEALLLQGFEIKDKNEFVKNINNLILR